jgi:alpha-beta hydrolase superfamily lysophospholipase
MPSGLDPGAISSQAEEVEAYRNDPLVHDRVSPNYSFPVIEAGDWVLKNAVDWDLPAFIAHGKADRIIDPAGSELFHEQATDTELHLLEGGYHELHHDKVRSVFFNALKTWLERWE